MVWRNSRFNNTFWWNDTENDLAMVESQRHQPNFVSMDKIESASYDQWKAMKFLFCLGNVWSTTFGHKKYTNIVIFIKIELNQWYKSRKSFENVNDIETLSEFEKCELMFSILTRQNKNVINKQGYYSMWNQLEFSHLVEKNYHSKRNASWWIRCLGTSKKSVVWS